eukprot:TRINITY_DN4442_c0_g3_i2.p1 TRINITY_DN4442_c0_g3~~TRINITY_DN4442_c0_g3_i2.p1  ORF type:complete len:1035 (+),score=143.45 TRINITY_DN4442_c0_g3_i2:68-3172(+)
MNRRLAPPMARCPIGILLLSSSSFWRIGVEAVCFPNLPERPKQNVKLRLIQHDWVSQKLSTQVAAIILKEWMMYDVEVVDSTHAYRDDFRLLATNQFDANFEVWPSGKEQEISQWIEPLHAGLADAPSRGYEAATHSMVSYEGMYVPKYMVQENSAAGFYQYLKTADAQERFSRFRVEQGEAAADPRGLCSKSEWGCVNFTWKPRYCEAGGCQAQLLHLNTDYETGLYEQQIATNGINMSVAYLTADTLHKIVWEASSQKQPIIFYSFEPHEGYFGIPSEDFVRVQFPPRTADCLAQEQANNSDTPLGGRYCASSAQRLRVMVSNAFRDSPDAWAFAQAFQLSQKDYGRLFELYRESQEVDDSSVPSWNQAACQWLHELDNERLSKMVFFSQTTPLTPSLSGDWLYVWVQLCLFVFSLVFLMKLPLFLMKAGRYCIRRFTKTSVGGRRKRSTSGDSDESDSSAGSVIDELKNRHSKHGISIVLSMLAVVARSPTVEVPLSILQGKMDFLSFKRSERNFCDPDGTSSSHPVQTKALFRFDTQHRARHVIQYFLMSNLPLSLWSSLNFALLAGSVASFLYIVKKNLIINASAAPDGADNFVRNASNFMHLVDGFSFLPVLMLSFAINKEASRWLEYISLSYSTMGRVGDLGLCVASGFRALNDQKDGLRMRAVQYRLYRYLNVAHYLCYTDIDFRVQSVQGGAELRQDLVNVRLLSEDEARRLSHTLPSKQREMVLGWMACTWQEEVRQGNVLPEAVTTFMDRLFELRSYGILHVEKAPTLMIVMLDISLRTLLLFHLIGQPLRLMDDTRCFQPWAMAVAFFLFFCYHGMITVMRTLEMTPFHPRADCINVDNLLCDKEREIFHMMRAGYSSTSLRQRRNSNRPSLRLQRVNSSITNLSAESGNSILREKHFSDVKSDVLEDAASDTWSNSSPRRPGDSVSIVSFELAASAPTTPGYNSGVVNVASLGSPLACLPADISLDEVNEFRAKYQAFRNGGAIGAHGEISNVQGGFTTTPLPSADIYSVRYVDERKVTAV